MAFNSTNHYPFPTNVNNQLMETHWGGNLWPETDQAAALHIATDDLSFLTDDFGSLNRTTTIDSILSNGDQTFRPDAHTSHSTLPNNYHTASTFNSTFAGSDLTGLWSFSGNAALNGLPCPAQRPTFTMLNGFQNDCELPRVLVQKHWKPQNKPRKQSVGKRCSKRTSSDLLASTMKLFECWIEQHPGEKPKRRQIQAFEALSDVSEDAIEEWFNRRVSEPFAIALSNSDAATKKLAATYCTGVQDHCTKNKDAETMARNRAASVDPARPFCCTSLCGATFPAKDDWNKHERLNRPQIGYFCNLDVRWLDGDIMRCARCNAEDPTDDHTLACMGSRKSCATKQIKRGHSGRVFVRKDKFKQHFGYLHPSVPVNQFVGSWEFHIEGNCEKRCGFCGLPLENWRHRIEHIGDHFTEKVQNGPWALDRWKSPWPEDENIPIPQIGDTERMSGEISFDTVFSG